MLNKLTDNQLNLLKTLVIDEKKYDRKFYRPVKVWKNEAKRILYSLKNNGIINFRKADSGVGIIISDALISDASYGIIQKILKNK